MRTKLYIAGLGLLLAGTSATTLIASGNQPGTRADEGVKTFDYMSVKPADGAEVKSFSSVSIKCFGNDFMTSYYCDNEKVTSVTVTKEGGETIHATSFGEPTMDDAWNYVYTINFPSIKEAGTYTLNIPEGLVVEGEWGDDWELYPMDGGMISNAYTSTFTINPDAESLLESYVLNPASGSNVSTLNNLTIEFPDVPFMGFQSMEDDAEITATNGSTVYYGMAMQDWNTENYDYVTMTVAFMDMDTWEPVVFEPGKWTLNISAGAFLYQGDASPEITAEYTVIGSSENKLEALFSFPANNSTVKEISYLNLYYPLTDPEASINFDAEKIDYINVEKVGGWSYAYPEIGEPELVMNDMYLMIPIMFSRPLTVSGAEESAEYNITLPSGLFYQTKFDEATGTFGVFEGYQENAEQTFHFTIDPNAPGLLEEYTLTPEANSSVSSLDWVSLVFDNVPSFMTVNKLAMEDITLVNGDTEYIGVANVMDYAVQNAFDIIFYDDKGEEALIESGSYTLTIPEGYFSINGEKNPEIKSVYNVMAAVITPAPGSTITDLNFKLEFPAAKKAEFVGAPYMITFGTPSAGVPSYNVEKVADAAVPTFKLTAPEGALVNLGENVLKIEAGAFLIDGEDGEQEGNSPFIEGVYTYEKEISKDYIPEPNNENNEVVCQSWGYTIGFVFEEGIRPRITSYDGLEVKFDDTVLRRGNEEECFAGDADYSVDVMDNILSFYVANSEYHKEGKISVTLNGNSYTLSGKPGFDISHSWNVVMPKEYDVVFAPVGGSSMDEAVKVTNFDDFTITFNNAEKVELFRTSGISLNKLDYSIFATPEIVEVEDAEVPTFKVVFNENDKENFTDGTYRLQIFYDTFTVDDVMTWPAGYESIEYYYDLDTAEGAVDSIGIDGNSKVTVVSVDGKVILDNQPASGLKNLENGVYVINGKKVVVKK
ncbi:MAG: hypothetical protein K2N05_10465 [Muribaculaceae bacterium]|nr:hypothetical protein [Muribaculaceae bacterium]